MASLQGTGKSDLLSHISSLTHLKVGQLCARLGQVCSKYSPVDLCLVTGDIAETGTQEDMKKAAQLSFGHQGIFANVHTPRVFLPGNHDRWQDEKKIPGGEKFDKVFSEEWPSGMGGVHHWSQTKPCPTTGKNETLGVVSADFCLRNRADQEGARGYIAQGRAYPEVVSALVQKTQEIRAEHDGLAFILWAFHFPPHFPYSKMRRDNLAGSGWMQLLESDGVIKAANDAGVTLIMGGHSHTRMLYFPDKTLYPNLRVFCASTVLGKPIQDEQGFHLLDFEIQGGQLVRDMEQTDFSLAS